MTKNHFICNMVEMLSIQHQDACISCSHCQQPSVGRCVSCELFMCEKCLKPHNDYPGFSDHVVLTIEELSKPENQWKIKGKSYCKKHSSKKLKLYCETCEELICTYCVVFEHVRPDHICSPLEEIAGRKREELKTACQSLEINECSETQDLCSKLESTSHNLNQDLEEVKRKIHERKNEVLAEVKKILEREATSLIHEEAIHAVRKQDEIDEELKRISEHKAGQRKVYDAAMALVDNGSNEQIMLSHKSVKQRVENGAKKYERAAKIEYQFSEYGDQELDSLFFHKIVTGKESKLNFNTFL